MRYYYKDKNNNYYNFKSEHSDLIAITEEEFNEHLPQSHIPTEQEKARVVKLNRIAELKAKLSSTDYQAIKYAEGVISEEDYAPIKSQRQEWRDEINALEELS